jgi:hypothetical protein
LNTGKTHNLFSVVGGLVAIATMLNLALTACGVPAAPQQPFAGRNLGGSDGECQVTTDTKKKTTTKKSVSLVDKKATSSKDDDEEISCDDKPKTGNGAGTAPLVNNGIVTPGQTLPGATPITAVPGNQFGTNTTTPGTQQLAQAVTYSAGVSAYLSRACTNCHGGGLFGRSPNLSTYDAAKAGATASLNSMKAGRMPTSGKPSDADIKLIESWIQGGMLQ